MDTESFNTEESQKIQQLNKLIATLIQIGTSEQFFAFFHQYHEADIAESLSEMSEKDRVLFFQKCNPELAAEVLEEMESEYQLQLIREFKTERAAKYIEEMEIDDAVDLLEGLYEADEEKADKIIDALPEEDAEDIKEFLAYEENTAGAIMTSDFVWIPENLTISDSIEIFRKQNPADNESSYYIFIVDEDGCLKGYMTIRDLLLMDSEESVKNIRNEDPIKVQVDLDQEDVAKIIQKYNLTVLPVVDLNNALVGIITVDDVVDVVVEEATEDIYKLSGTGDIDESKLLHGRPWPAIMSRLPWLLMTIVGGIIAAYVISTYSTIFPTHQFSLAISLSFVPLLMGLAGNVGNQSSTIIVRGLSTGILKDSRFFKIIGRELFVGIGIGFIVGICVWVSLIFTGNSLMLSGIVACSIFINTIVATFIGVSLPLLFKRLKIDPAVASAPFISTTLDIVGQIVYFMMTLYALLYILN